MALSTGTRLGTFEVVAMLGAGGMGEVYKALDTRLNRTVAIKVLPPHWADNSEMRQRFEREAQTIASLNHPNICTLHDIGRQDGTDFLVMEYLEGETLAERLARGYPRRTKPSSGRVPATGKLSTTEDAEDTEVQPEKSAGLPLDEALQIAIQIADALDKAHRKGVTHRDLKPSNIMLTASGAKLLDFGLAKLKAGGSGWSGGAGGAGGAGGVSGLPTDQNLTAQGTILGTLQYMAPEQLEGTEADARTDIFAFGVVLYEMVTGKKAFEGKSRVLLMSAIVTSEPPTLSTQLSAAGERLRPLPSAQARGSSERGWGPASIEMLDHVVKTCLAKDPADRWQDARDLLAELQWVAGGGAKTVAAAPRSVPLRKRDLWSVALIGAAVLLVAALATPAVRYLRGPAASEELRFRVPIQLTAQATFTNVFNPGLFNPENIAIAPDGHAIAFVARNNATEPWSMFVRPVGSVTPQRLAGAEEAAQPFWSADSRSIAFISGGKLKKVEASGGPPQDICETADFSGGAWNSDGTIVFGTAQGLFRVSAQGGKPTPLTTLGSSETGHFWPRFLPDGRHYLYLAWSGQAGTRAIFAGTLDAKEKTKVMAAESKAIYAAPGYLLFRRENTVYAQSFDAKKLTLAGEPVRVADEVPTNGSNGEGDFDVSRDGALLYFHGFAGAGAGPQSDTTDWQLVWIDRMGGQLDTVGPFGPYRGVNLSPDGKRTAVHRHETTGGDIWVIEPRGAVTRLTFDASRHNSMPIWSPDGSKIVYSSLQKGKWGLYQTLSNGSGTEELLFESDLLKVPMSWSPDSKRIVFWLQDSKTAGDLWILPLDGDKKPTPFVATPFNESHGQISPDGKWIAYASNATGRNEIYVQPFPSGSGRWQVSTAGGDWPRWKRDGKEIFFHALGSGAFIDAILSAAVTAGATFEAGGPKELVRTPALNIPHSGGDYQMYDVSADGQRFLIAQYAVQTAAAVAGPNRPDPANGLVVALNWASALKK